MRVQNSTMRKRSLGYLLIVVMGITLFCLTVLLALTIWSQESALLTRSARLNLLHSRLRWGVQRELRSVLNKNLEKSLDEPTDFELSKDMQSARVNWGDDSVHNQIEAGWADGGKLFKDWAERSPELSFEKNDQLPAWLSSAKAHSSGPLGYQTVYSSAVPYLAFSPWGRVQVLGSLRSWSNPHYDSKTPLFNSLPVRVKAYEGISVEQGRIAPGVLEVENGEFSLPDDCAAIAYNGRPITDDFTIDLREAVDSTFRDIETGVATKTDFISRSFLTPEGLYDLFTGKTGLGMIFSIRQACSVPLPLFWSNAEGPGYEALLFHHPYPVDGSDYKTKGDSFNSFSHHIMHDLKKTYDDAKKSVREAWKGVEDVADVVWDGIKGAFDWASGKGKKSKKEFEKAKKKWENAKEHFHNAWDALKDAFGDSGKILQDVGEFVEAPPPRTETDELDFIVEGWDYLGILGHISEDLGDFFRAISDSNSKNWNQTLAHFTNFTRVVHFTDREPEGGFREDGGFALAATWTVPPGRTLKWHKRTSPGDFVVVGDLWIQRGATMVVDGNLFVARPPGADWLGYEEEQAWDYRSMEGHDSGSFPTGTIYLEEGASLLVTGDLYAQGDETHGSVCVSSSLDSSPAVTTAILCRGDVRLVNGIECGTPMDQVISNLASDGKLSSSVADLNNKFLRPLLKDIAPHLAKVLGPFDDRTCWFATRATSIMFFPELVEVGLAGPWPIPMPYHNCMRRIFDPLTTAFKWELNFLLGNNLYTHSFWWPFSNGQTAILPKRKPDTYVSALEEFLSGSAEELSVDKFMDQIEEAVEEVLPELAIQLIEDGIQTVVAAFLSQFEGGLEDPCAPKEDDDDDESGEEEEGGESHRKSKIIEKHLKEFVGEQFKKTATKVKAAYLAIWKDELRSKSGSLPEDNLRELAGVFLWADGALSIGTEENRASKVTGLVVCGGDLNIVADFTLGAVASRTGDVNIDGDLFYYPYFTRAFLHNPEKPEEYGVDVSKTPKFLQDFITASADAVYLKTPTKGTGLNLGSGGVHVLAEGLFQE